MTTNQGLNAVVPVDLGEKSYNIYINYDLATDFIRHCEQHKYSSKALLITDDNVAQLYGENISKLLSSLGFNVRMAVIPAGESSKNIHVAEHLYTVAAEHGLDRKSPIIALGGGVVGDIAGFIAATFMRGVPFIQIPTTLLAQVDSSVGGKVAVNHQLGKNLIGAFYQPQAVFINLAYLDSLPQREILTGMGEIIKYGYIYDAELLDYLAKNHMEIMALQADYILNIVARCCAIKAEVVAKDEQEQGLRAILNFGHTLAHAIEAETHYELYNHGEAVAIGMVGAAQISYKLGRISRETVNEMINIIASYGLPIKAKQCKADNVYRKLFHDKKAVGGKLKWILLRDKGNVSISDNVPEQIVKDTIIEILESHK